MYQSILIEVFDKLSPTFPINPGKFIKVTENIEKYHQKWIALNLTRRKNKWVFNNNTKK